MRRGCGSEVQSAIGDWGESGIENVVVYKLRLQFFFRRDLRRRRDKRIAMEKT